MSGQVRRHGIGSRRATVLVATTVALVSLLLAPAGPALGGKPTRQLAMGVAMDGSRTVATLDTFAQSVGGHVPALWTLWYEWGKTQDLPDAALLDAIVARGSVPMLNWSPVDSNQLLSPKYRYKRIINGAHDAYIRSFATALRDWGGTVVLRFAFEMNGNWFPWSAQRFDNSPARFRLMWRHVYDIFRGKGGVGATNVKFLWAPYRPCRCPSYASLYPGDAYVQFTGFSAFNWARKLNAWREMVPLYRVAVEELLEVAKRKRILIAETASSPRRGDKAAWIRNGYPAVYKHFPKVAGIVYFNVFVQGHPNWLLTRPAASLEAYAEIAGRPKFQGRIS